MIRGVSRIAALAAAILAAGSLSAAEEVLYWMVGDDATVNDHGTYSSVSDFLPTETDDSWSAARIRVTGGDIVGDVFLDVYDSDGTLQVGSGALGIAFGDTGSGYWGAGVPTGNQSPLGGYAAGDPEYSFIIELGNVSWDGNAASWVTVAESAAASYSSLYDAGYIASSFNMNPTTGAAWAPTSYNVPEPSSGLLLLVGGGLLLLRRRKADVT
jgi:hypothetical protein